MLELSLQRVARLASALLLRGATSLGIAGGAHKMRKAAVGVALHLAAHEPARHRLGLNPAGVAGLVRIPR